jgi:hypothetical protein
LLTVGLVVVVVVVAVLRALAQARRDESLKT